jgi:hypothetical protein
MWNFERYQRWVEQKKDWALPTLAPPLPEDRPQSAAPRLQRSETPLRPMREKPIKDDAVEISIDEEVDLDELARRIERGTRG